MTVLIAGGSGFLGTALGTRLRHDGHRVRNLTRRARPGADTDIPWTPDGSTGPWTAAIADADIVVNLAGEGIADKRWTRTRKLALRNSRILATRSLVRALADAAPQSRLLVTGSAIGIYGAHGDAPVTEDTPAGDDFLAHLVRDWEQEAARAVSVHTRVVAIRSGLVLGSHGGALQAMRLPFRLGVGGPMGSGRQYMPWIHLQDWVGIVVHAIASHGPETDTSGAHDRAIGVTAWNATAPEPVPNAHFARALGRALHRPAILTAPAFAMRLALGEMAEMLLTGARVLPVRAEQAGYQFRFRTLEGALQDLFP